MRTIETILSEVKKAKKNANIDMIKRAFAMAENAHEGQKRKSGDPYLLHPLEVAYILANKNMDEESIVAGLLHDIVEDTDIPLKSIEKEFGKEVSEIVDGLTKLSKISFQAKDVRQNESFRKMLLAMSKDIRVIIIKLVDRLHNMRTLDHMSSNRQQAISQETLDIYAPIAHRLGISWIKTELENLAFKYLHPEAYEKLRKNIQKSEKENTRYVQKVLEVIEDRMNENKLSCEVTGRYKHLFSIFRKMEMRNLDFEQITDLIAFRIMVDTIPQCYEALGYIHSIWKPVPGKFKDYIALPKENMYQSLHTAVIGPDGSRIEVQIRTHKMHKFAEEGVAAHWAYKTGDSFSQEELEQLNWIKRMLELQEDLPDSHEFIESVKIDLYSDEVFVFTPRGEVIELPKGSTPIDFAYRIHTEVGHHCKGARVNEKMVPLRHQLRNGDIVDIITDPNMLPSKDWLNFVKTSKAKSKIRSVLRQEQRDTGKLIGQEILDRELRKIDLSITKITDNGTLKKILDHLKLGHIDELFLGLGYGKIELSHFLPLLHDEKETNESIISKISSTLPSIRKTSTSPILVGGKENILIRFGKCCDPLPGDPIIGFVTRGKGVTVHKNDCVRLLDMDPERKIDVDWAQKDTITRIVKIKVISRDTPGILAEISKIISKGGSNIASATCSTTQDQMALNIFEISIQNAEQLRLLMGSIEHLDGIISVERTKSNA
ncbi:MAG: bifunctional (p)ppGpp synthetase/guanosine-3',5'-bis(diphosphate) 3'-pyrophosphohydrolase [Bdellovibrionales bacterium]|nr:bifunctional (p)ppGpp synthetase/guanosine-3',5'-bis(diphosphate) 3'-pyrophosphohydrolase [Bdellovibrionales bacterium]